MAALDDLKTAVAALTDSTASELKAISDKLSGLGDSVSAADVETAVAQIGAVTKSMSDETAALTGVPPAAV